MAVVVVGGGGRGVGKTALVCGVIAALPEMQWVAVKIAGHEHGLRTPGLGRKQCRARDPIRLDILRPVRGALFC